MLLACLAASAGCGLQDYQVKMEKQSELIHYKENENNLLERIPLLLPDKQSKSDKDKAKKDDGEIVKGDLLFIRPPLGINSKGDPKSVGLLSVFPAKNDKTGLKEMRATLGKRSELEAVVPKVLKELGLSGTPRVKILERPDGESLSFDYLESQNTRLYFYKSGRYYAAIVYVLTPTTGPGDLEIRIQLSMKSIKLGSAASTLVRDAKPAPSTTGKGNTPPKRAAPGG
jgi:hypothetical protein